MTARWPAPCGCDLRNSWDRPMTHGPEQVICPEHFAQLQRATDNAVTGARR